MLENKLSCVIVDDEVEALDLLEILLADENVRVLDKITDSSKVLKSILKNKPDILFLDINMPNSTGLDIIKSINEANVEVAVVFVTAFDDYIFDAIKNSAFDYLVKPVDIEELKETLNRYRNQNADRETFSQVFQSLDFSNKIKVPMNSGYLFLDIENILFIRADAAYSYICSSDREKEVFSNTSLGKYEELLSPKQFLRVSRQYLINANYLSMIDKKEQLCYLKKCNREESVHVSKKSIKMLDEIFDHLK
ncbi:response regulator transcription factor [Marinilabiliaceae bacterium JC040]|nr:response regulator transcription factor [Marinilabiliaceae bacterium JC040]